MTASPARLRAPLNSRWGIAALVGLVVAAALAVGILYRTGSLGGSPPSSAGSLGSKFAQGFNRLQMVAGMLASRSPGERAEGALASLKHKRLPVLHERALPKVRRSLASPSPLAAIVAPPPGETPVVPAITTLNAVPPPETVVALAETPPLVFPGFTPPGGGGFIVPPIVTQLPPPVIPPSNPPANPPSGVPEPASWAMMLIGFALIGSVVRLRPSKTLIPVCR